MFNCQNISVVLSLLSPISRLAEVSRPEKLRVLTIQSILTVNIIARAGYGVMVRSFHSEIAIES